jgi:Purple acid Phosphatase, N-terminal domain
MTVMIGGQLYSTPAGAQVAPTTKKAGSVKITEGPEIERVDSHLTIIRWATNNPGGSPEHYGVVRYGTNPKDLSQTAKSPVRLNPGHPETVFRVRIEGLKPGTTYYYTVDSMEANGTGDGVKSAVKEFTTR